MIIEHLITEKESVKIEASKKIEEIIFAEYQKERKKIIDAGIIEFQNLHKLDENFELYDSEKIRNKIQELKKEELKKIKEDLVNYYLFRLKECDNNMLIFLLKYYPNEVVNKDIINYYLSKGYGNK